MAGSGDAVPSKKFPDLEANMPNLDAFTNSTDLAYINRESPNGNVNSRTVAGINNAADIVINDIQTRGDATIDDIQTRGDIQLAGQSDAFQNQFAFTQPTLPWAPGIVIADELQIYSTGTIGESGYKEWRADPQLLPFTTSATFAEDEALGRWAVAIVATESWVNENAIPQIATTELLISSSLDSAVTVIFSTGYSSSFDNGHVKWYRNGVTGQTPSQSPIQLGDFLLNDADGNQWSVMKDDNTLCVEHIGYYVGTDFTPFLEVAINYSLNNNGGNLKLGASTYDFQTELAHAGGTLNMNIECVGRSTVIKHSCANAAITFTNLVNGFSISGYPRIVNYGQKTTASTQAFMVFNGGNTRSKFEVDYAPQQLITDVDLLAGLYYCKQGEVNDTVDFYVNVSGITSAGITLGAGSTVYLWGGRLIGAWKPFPSFTSAIGLNVTGGMGGLYVMGTDIIQNRINCRIAKDTGTSNREIFFNPAILDSSWRSLQVTDESYISAPGLWAASANDACIFYKPTSDSLGAVLNINGGTIFNAGINDPTGIDGDGTGIKLGAYGKIMCDNVLLRNNAGRAIFRTETGGDHTSTFSNITLGLNATRAAVNEQIYLNGRMNLSQVRASDSDENVVSMGTDNLYKMSNVDTETHGALSFSLTGSMVAWVNMTGHDVIAYIRDGVGTAVFVDSNPFIAQASGGFAGASVIVPVRSSLQVQYTVKPDLLFQKL